MRLDRNWALQKLISKGMTKTLDKKNSVTFLTQTQTASAFKRVEDVVKRKKEKGKENLIISFNLTAVPPIVLPRMACTATRR